jgi:16S rRNA (uracil1498-N3)-methyltransferase
VVRWTGDKARDAVNRLRRVAREAAMQAHRARIPEVDDPVAVAGLAGAPGLVVAERAEVHPGAPWDPAVAGAMASEWLVVIGPEGGFDPGERALLAPAARLTIGPHVLRAVTAPVAAAALLVARRS